MEFTVCGSQLGSVARKTNPGKFNVSVITQFYFQFLLNTFPYKKRATKQITSVKTFKHVR